MLRAARRYPSIYPSTTTAPPRRPSRPAIGCSSTWEICQCAAVVLAQRARVGLTSQTAEEQGQGRASC